MHPAPNQNKTIAQVVNFLNGVGYLAWRQENNGRINKAKAVSDIVKLIAALKSVNYSDTKISELVGDIIDRCYCPVPSSRKGVPDVIGFHLTTGIWISVEIKVGTDVMRPDQEDFRTYVRKSKAEWWLCREIESFKAGWYRKHQPQLEAA